MSTLNSNHHSISTIASKSSLKGSLPAQTIKSAHSSTMSKIEPQKAFNSKEQSQFKKNIIKSLQKVGSDWNK